MHDDKYQCKMHIPLTIYNLTDGQKEPYQKQQQQHNENVGEISGEKKSKENGPLAENAKTERAIGLGRKTREEIGNGNQITALRFRPDRTPVSSP